MKHGIQLKIGYLKVFCVCSSAPVLPRLFLLQKKDGEIPSELSVVASAATGISDVKQRKWLMSMLMFVRDQNGALAEAIRIRKRNSDKEFEGVEDCPICYSESLPSKAGLRDMQYKFYKACLEKWFFTAHKKLCPLCQSPC